MLSIIALLLFCEEKEISLKFHITSGAKTFFISIRQRIKYEFINHQSSKSSLKRNDFSGLFMVTNNRFDANGKDS